MTKLIKHLILFLIPIILIIVFVPANNRLKYQGLENDCLNRGIWVHDRINHNPNAVDIAFIGSSHTINAINDRLIDSLSNTHSLNLGYCRLGRNMSYALFKELLSKKKPKHLILEVREDENWFGHPIFPFIASTEDVMLAYPFFNDNLFKDPWIHFCYKAEIFQNELYQENDLQINTNNYGFFALKNGPDKKSLDMIKEKNKITKQPLNKIKRDYKMSYSRGYLKRIHHLCLEHEVSLSFLYLPSYGTNLNLPKEYETYTKYGEVIIPPSHILENQMHWANPHHLNLLGANKLSQWLTKKIGYSLIIGNKKAPIN